MAVILDENFDVAVALTGRRGISLKQPSRVGIVNLMPLKERTEADLIRILDHCPVEVEIDFISMSSHRSKNSSQARVDRLYIPSSEAMKRTYDGVIVTGAPVELYDFEDVDYWNELTVLMDWCRINVKSTMYVCWGAFAALHHFYGIGKRILDFKLSGVYRHTVRDVNNLIASGFDDEFDVPHSRNTEIDRKQLDHIGDLKIVVASDVAGPHLISGRNGREFYVMGHWEYAPDTLDMEYRRDCGKGLNPKIPENYYIGNDPSNTYSANWKAHGNMFYINWLTYFVAKND